MTRKITFTFSDQPPAKNDTGLKFVLWEILIPPVDDKSEPTIKHDWGFAMWLGSDWEVMEVPEGWAAVVCRWANTVHPNELLTKKSKIITLGGLN